jgi:hypothetical protein
VDENISAAQSSDVHPTEVPAPPGPVEGDWVCIACEYPLRGLDPKGKCPECGTSIARSLRDDRLAHASPFWVFRLSQATTMLCLSTALALIFELPFYLPIATTIGPTFSRFSLRFIDGIEAINLIAKWLLGTPEPVAPGIHRSRGWGWSIRIISTVAVLWRWMPISFVMTMNHTMFVWGLLIIAGLVVEFLYLRKLAARLPDQELYVHVPYVLAALSLMHVMLSIVPRVYFVFGIHLPPVPPALMALVILCARGYAIVIFAKFSTRFTRAANEAMQNYGLE